MKLRPFLTVVVAGAILYLGAADLAASPIQLGAFIGTPESAVDVFDNGFTIKEDPVAGGYNPVSFGNMYLSIPGDALSLDFDFKLYVPKNNRDFFDFCIGSASTPVFESGGSGELAATGHFTYDLTELAGSTVPVIFHLMSDWGDNGFDSSVTITHARVSLVPIPGTLILLSSGILCVVGMKKGKKGENRRKHGLS